MRPARFLIAGFLLISLTMPGCKTTYKPRRIKVAVSIFPLYDLVRQVAGDEVEVFCLMPPGANPHTFAPRPSDMARLEGVDCLIAISPDFDGWAAGHLPASVDRLYLGPVDEDTAHDEHDHDHHHGEDNPHVWLSVSRVRAMLPTIQAALENVKPAGVPGRVSPHGLFRLNNGLDSLDQLLVQRFADIDNKSFFQWHAAWDFLAEDYGLNVAGTLEQGHGDTPSVKTMKALVERGREEEIKVVVVGLNVESPAAETLAREIGGQILRLDTMGNAEVSGRDTYLALMHDNSTRLAEALKAQ